MVNSDEREMPIYLRFQSPFFGFLDRDIRYSTFLFLLLLSLLSRRSRCLIWGGISMFQDDSLIGRCFQRVCKRQFAVDRREGKFLGGGKR